MPQSDTYRDARRRWARRSLKAVCGLPLAYLLGVLIGLCPANRGFRPAPTGVDIYVVSNGVHVDIIVPTQTEVMDWRVPFPASHFAPGRDKSHIQFGWGDRQFYIETPTWADARTTTVLKSMLLPTSGTLHVAYTAKPRASTQVRRLRLSPGQYRLLVSQVRRTVVLDSAGMPIRIPNAGYHAYDGFYEAHGTYHLLNTCNCWTGRTLRKAGVRVGIWTPLPWSVMSTLPTDTLPTDTGMTRTTLRMGQRLKFRTD